MKDSNSIDFFSSRRGVANDVHSGLTESQVMLRTLVAMSIPAVMAVLAMGEQAFYNIITAVVTSLIAHYILKAIELKSFWKLREATYESVYSPLVAGLIVGLSMGELSPYYVTALVSLLTMVVFKWGQEKYFDRKVVNPAAGAKALVLLVLTLIWTLPDSLVTGMLFYPEHLDFALYTEEGFLGAMQLAEQMGFYGTENLSIAQSLFLWKRHGWIGGASGIVTLGAGVLLAYWIKLKWRISVAFLGGMAALSVILGLATGGHLALRIGFHVFTGSVIFLGFFMATEPQTTPVTVKGQYIFGGLLALLTMVFQLAGLFGSSFVALAIMNPFASYFDRIGEKEPFGKEERRFSPAESIPTAPDTTSPVLTYDPGKCIKCSRCIKACAEVQGNAVLGYGSRGRNIFATAGLGERGFSACTACGECLEYCPTGALTEKYPVNPLRDWETKTVRSTCSYCGVGCQLELFVKDNEVAKVRGVDAAPNNGSLCIRGRFGHTYRDQTNRLTQPLKKRGESLEPVTWEEALNTIAKKLATYKSGEVGGLSSAQNTNEENYLFQKFMRTVINTNNVDYFSRLNHTPTALGLKGIQGVGTVSGSIDDIHNTDCIFITEAEINESHPIVSNYIKQAVNNFDTNLIMISSRKSRLTDWADIWLKPDPGTEVNWLNGLANIIINENLHDSDFVQDNVENFLSLKQTLEKYTPEKVAEISGLSTEELKQTANMFAKASKAVALFNQGITQNDSGVNNVAALANLVLLTGNIGKKGAGIYPLKDENNDQGALDMGVAPEYLPGYQAVKNDKVRDKFSTYWGSQVPSEKGLNAVQMIERAVTGDLKAMILMGESRVFSEPNLGEIKRGLENLDFLVTITPFLNDVAQEADIVLPSATFVEKNGTFTNLERRVQQVNKAIEPLEEARSDWEIITALAARMGYQMNYNHPSAIMDEIAELTPIYAGVNYFSLDNSDGLQWPVDRNTNRGTEYLTEPLNENKRWFIPVGSGPKVKSESMDYSYRIMSDRILYHFRTGFADPQIEALKNFLEKPYAEINSDDAVELDLDDGDRIKIITPFGDLKGECRIRDRIKEGNIFVPAQFLPFHYQEISYEIAVNYTGDKQESDEKITIPQLCISECRIEKLFSEED